MTGNEGYPRDMVGYGRTPPFAEKRTALAEIDRIAALRL